ncbi:MAG: Holliday junction resolvase RuvX [Chloroflexi bacterium]|nr:Holliday junction resolvase RuvX [Chloroflexota bacterium]
MRSLGLDVGESRIGVAVSDPFRETAQPLEVVDRRPDGGDVRRIKEIISEYKVDELVVGLPLTMQGEAGPQAKAVAEYASLLEREIGLPMKLWDERLSTVMVERSMVSGDVKRRKRKKIVDKLAAVVILQGYLDARRTSSKG